MLYTENHSDCLIIVLHEIYGINRHIQQICEQFAADGYDVVCPDLTNVDKVFAYEQAELAYRRFMDEVGFASAILTVEKLIRQNREKYKKIVLVGYSIGATIAWHLSRENHLCDGIVGYYGSRIRDYVGIVPKCPALLFFPTKEKSFEVERRTAALDKPNVEIHVLEGAHGFCDPYSVHYSEPSHLKASRWADDFLCRIRR